MSFKKTLLVELCLSCALVGRIAHADPVASAAASARPIASPQNAATQNAATPDDSTSLASAASNEVERRRESLREQNTVSGSTGLLHLNRPGSGAAGTFRVSVLFDVYSGSGVLCSPGTPCKTSTQDSADRAGTVLGLSVTPLSYLEAYGSLRSAASYDDQHSPGLINVVGNTNLGLKLFSPDPLAGWLSLGGLAELQLLNGSGKVGLSGKGTSFRAAALADADLRGLSQNTVPLRLLSNLGYIADNSGALIQDTETSRGARITRVERFGLGINRVDRFQVGLGVEAELAVVRPFAEWNLEVPVNRQNYVCNTGKSDSGDRCLASDHSFSAFPSSLTLGARVSPFIQGLSATVALDIGTSGTSNFIEELAPTLPWDLWLGVGYAFDVAPPKSPPVVESPRVAVAPVAPPLLRIRGFVHEHAKEEGIPNAILHYRDRELTAMASGADGHFVSTDLEPGTYTFAVEADGYQPGQCSVVIALAPAPVSPSVASSNISYTDADCALEALSKAGNVIGHVLDAESSSPVAGATVELIDSLHRRLSLVTDGAGSFRFEQVIPGAVTVDAVSRAYSYGMQTFSLAVRQDANAELRLRKRPKLARVVQTATELRLNQAIHFEANSGALASDADGLLLEVADALAQNPRLIRLEVQGASETNPGLSEARANAVMDWLVAHGIDSHRLTASGSPPGHARGRGIQLRILEQTPAQ